MAGAFRKGSFRISPVDRLGRRIDPVVLAAVAEILRSAVSYGMKRLDDYAVTANLLEEAAATVSRRLHTRRSGNDGQQIRNVPGFLLFCFKRKVYRVKRRQIEMVRLGEADSLVSADPSAQFLMKILADECLARFDCVTRDIVMRRVFHGYSSEQAGGVHGMSAHAAQERCRHAFQQLRKKLKMEDGHFRRIRRLAPPHRTEASTQPKRGQNDERRLPKKNS